MKCRNKIHNSTKDGNQVKGNTLLRSLYYMQKWYDIIWDCNKLKMHTVNPKVIVKDIKQELYTANKKTGD